MRTRKTKRQTDVLDMLSGNNLYCQAGTQLYNAASVTRILNVTRYSKVSINSVRNTLKLLASKGLVIVERKKANVLTGLGDIERELDHYWNVATVDQNRLTAQ